VFSNPEVLGADDGVDAETDAHLAAGVEIPLSSQSFLNPATFSSSLRGSINEP